MLPAAVMARLANSALPIWLWEILSSLAVAARILTVFGVAISSWCFDRNQDRQLEPMDRCGCCLRGSPIRCLTSTLVVVPSRYEIVT